MNVGDKYIDSHGTIYYVTEDEDDYITLTSDSYTEVIDTYDIRDYFHDNGLKYIGHESDPKKIPGEVSNLEESLLNDILRIAGIQLNEEYNEENIKINDIFVDSEGNEYKVTDIDDTYGEDKYGQPAVYVTFNNKMGMPSTAIKYIFHKKQ